MRKEAQAHALLVGLILLFLVFEGFDRGILFLVKGDFCRNIECLKIYFLLFCRRKTRPQER